MPAALKKFQTKIEDVAYALLSLFRRASGLLANRDERRSWFVQRCWTRS